MNGKRGLRLFDGYGIELEYMLVDRETLSVLPVADRLLKNPAGVVADEVEMGPLCWSNEMALHLIELKTNGPVDALEGLGETFLEHVGRINRLLGPLGGELMGSGMHPWMDPLRETRIWPHRNSPIYDSYHRIFGCRDHGWTNLQSIHLNLPFRGDEEFGRLHAAVRLVLPIMPALAASSPVVEGKVTGFLDNRLEAYRTNQRRIPSITGRVIPEPIYSRRDYRERVLKRLYRDIAPYDPDRVLQHEWLNSRGAIPRFDRGTIEIRLLDMQECPRADLAVSLAVVAVIKALVAERWTPLADQQAWEVEPLEEILLAAIREGEDAPIRHRGYPATFGFTGKRPTAGMLWRHLVETLAREGSPHVADARRELSVILEQGPLARRILRRLGESYSPERTRAVYKDLCECLAQGRMFLS